jgi:N-dimethylarginine dimethylaminohydrolase
MHCLNIEDEISPLSAVVLGIPDDRGEINLNNPTVAQYARLGQLPTDQQLHEQVRFFSETLKASNIDVIRPKNIAGHLQLFVRDLGFVIGDTFVWANLKKENRRIEQEALRPVIERIPGIKTLSLPSEVFIEGGDVVMLGDKVFVGVGIDRDKARTSIEAVNLLRRYFSNKEVIEITTNASDAADDDPETHVLHLDCAFQPIGWNHAVFFPGGFVGRPDPIFDFVGEDRLLHVSGPEMRELWPNLFSISPDRIISAPTFLRLNNEIQKLGISVLEVPYHNVGKLGGSFRCSTLPLMRREPSERVP